MVYSASMNRPLDTLAVARRLERNYGFDPRQAEGVAETLHEHVAGNVATRDDISTLKDDIAALRTEMAAMESRLETKIADGLAAMEARLEAKIAATEARLEAKIADGRTALTGLEAKFARWITAQTVAIVGLMLALKFIS